MDLNFQTQLFPHKAYAITACRVDIQLTTEQARFLHYIAVAANSRGDETLKGRALVSASSVTRWLIDRLMDAYKAQVPEDVRRELTLEEPLPPTE